MTAIEATQQMLHGAHVIGAPILGGALIAGLLASVLQALVQLQEPTLGLVARAAGIWIVCVWQGDRLLQWLVELTAYLFSSVGR